MKPGATIFDGLREGLMRNGAWKSPSPQSELAPIQSTHYSGFDPSGIGVAWTTSRSSRTYSGGGITPQEYTTAQPVKTNELVDAGMAMNARAALPNRGVTPRSPMMRRR